MPAMNALSAAELASLQADAVNAACDKVCVVKRKSPRVPTAQGGNNATPQIVETTVVGLEPPNATDLQNYDYIIGSKAAWRAKMPVATVTQELDQLIVEGQTLEVAKRLKPRSIEILRTFLVVEVANA